MSKLAGKVAIVSGSGRGIGREIALKLASDGAAVDAPGPSVAPLGRIARFYYMEARLLDEERLWNALRHMARQARAAFEDWEDYLVSVILGHALANEDWLAGKRLIRGGMALLDGITPFAEYPSPWQACPVERLPVLHSVACRRPGDSYRT